MPCSGQERKIAILRAVKGILGATQSSAATEDPRSKPQGTKSPLCHLSVRSARPELLCIQLLCLDLGVYIA